MNKILFLSGNVFPCRAGDSIFSAGVLARLSKHYQVSLATYGEEEKIINDENYKEIRPKLFDAKFIKYTKRPFFSNYLALKYGHKLHYASTELLQYIKTLLSDTSNSFDFIIIDHLRMYSLFKEFANLIDRKKTKIILLAHNVEYENMRESIFYSSHSISTKYRNKIFNYNLKKFESDAVKDVDILWGLCQKDIDVLTQLINNSNKRNQIVKPYFNYPMVKNKTQIISNTYNLLFLGSMSWYPNVQGVKYFIENIFPKLLHRDTRYKLYIVGNQPHTDILKYQSDKIIVTGEVVSVDDYIQNSDFVIIPNRLGSGVKIKVLESIMKGIPVISFPESLIGYSIELFKNGFIVNNDDEFIDSIISLNQSPERKIEFIETARNSLLQIYDEPILEE